MNGTTNFMLTKMVRENLGFDEALKIAQELGYAETKDPGDDVDGRDACRKIAILSSLVCGHQIYPQNIPTRGIRDITVADVAAAERLNCVIKLIAWMKRGDDGSVAAGVEPCLVPTSHQLAGVDDVFNAVLVKGDMLGDVVFYGKGAGKLPTASAVVADVVDALKERLQGPRQPVLAACRAGGGDAHRPGARRILCACGRRCSGRGGSHLRHGPCGG